MLKTVDKIAIVTEVLQILPCSSCTLEVRNARVEKESGLSITCGLGVRVEWGLGNILWLHPRILGGQRLSQRSSQACSSSLSVADIHVQLCPRGDSVTSSSTSAGDCLSRV